MAGAYRVPDAGRVAVVGARVYARFMGSCAAPSLRIAPWLAPWLLVPALGACGGAPSGEASKAPAVALVIPRSTGATGATARDADPLSITAADPAWGDADAPVTLVQIGDFRNPFCAQHAPWIRELQRRYRPDVLRVVWKSAPRPDDPVSRSSALAAAAVFVAGGARAFWTFYDLAFDASPDIMVERLEAFAARAGVRRDAYRRALADPATARKVEADAALVSSLRLAPPHVLVNGVLVMGFSSIDEFTSAIDAAWDEASLAIERGVPRARVSAERTREHLEADLDLPPAERARRAWELTPAREPAPAPEPAAPLRMGAKHLVVMYLGARRAPSQVTRTKAEARARAEEALKKARAGAPFEDLVRLYSDEPGAAARGGDLGRFPKGAMVPEFEQAVLRTKVGAVSDVFETPFGFHILVRTE